MTRYIHHSYISVSIPTDLWEKVYPIISFMESFSSNTDFDFKVWPKGTPEPEIPGIQEVEE